MPQSELLHPTAVKRAGYPWSVRTLQRYRDQGIGPAYIRAAGKIFYRCSDLDAYLEKHRVIPVREAS